MRCNLTLRKYNSSDKNEDQARLTHSTEITYIGGRSAVMVCFIPRDHSRSPCRRSNAAHYEMEAWTYASAAEQVE